jgi:hypothetical protein
MIDHLGLTVSDYSASRDFMRLRWRRSGIP